MRRWLLLVPMLALAACNPQPASYTPEVERNFTAACLARAASSSSEVCGCVWDRIETEISPSDFAALERLPAANREAHPLTAQINGYIEACNVEVTPPATIAPGDEVPAP
jgi:hypothetical protein